MKKGFLVILFILAFSVTNAAASTVDDLAALARYFPAEAPLYVAFYISDEAIANWDAALRQLFFNYDGRDAQNPLRTLLDESVQDIRQGGTFASVYRPWLGNTMAVGALTPETLAFGSRNSTGESSVLFVAEVIDHDLAEAHMDAVITSGEGLFDQFERYQKTVEDDYILYHPGTPQQYEITFLLLEDALFLRFSSVKATSIVPDYEQTLAEVSGFEEALRRLPLDRYEIMGYFDPSALVPYAEDYETEISVNTILPENANTAEALEALGAQSFGFTFVDTLAMTFDWATYVDDPQALEAAGIDIITSPPVDLEVTHSLPTTIQAFIQDTGLGLGVLQMLQYFKATGSYYREFYEDARFEYMLALSWYYDMAINMLVSYNGLREIMPDALQDEHILYSTIPDYWANPRAIGLLLEMPDVQAALLALPEIFAAQDISVEENGERLVLSGIAEAAEDDSLTMLVVPNQNYVQIGFKDSLINFDRDDVLGDDAAYQRAEALFVPNAQIIGYVNATNTPDVENLFESVSISTTYDEAGTGYIRMVWQIYE